jgi:quercetin dioxygenase-like cupin family protein
MSVTPSLRAVVLATLVACTPGLAQQPGPAAVEIADEPHHSLLLRNAQMRVFRLKLQPGEATLPHHHGVFYAFLSLRPVVIGNEVRDRQPVVTRIEAGELHTSKGGFTLAERNSSSEPADLLVIEALKADAGEFSAPMGGVRFHDAALGELFQASAVRGYTFRIAAGGHTEQHGENYDRLLIAVTDLKFREDIVGQSPSEFVMKAGEVRWIPRGQTHATTNVGASPASFITLEFN